jgi:hypothetical protein
MSTVHVFVSFHLEHDEDLHELLASRIPCCRLREALEDHAELRDVGRLTLRRSLECFRLALRDEETGKLVALRDLATPLGSRGR